MARRPDPPRREPPGLEDLARRYLDLWQEQLSAVLGDPGLAEGMGRLMQMLGPPGPGGWRHETGAENAGDVAGGRRGAGRAKAGVASSGRGGDELARLERRLARIEERLDRLEAGTRGRRRGATPRARGDRA